MDDLKYYAAEKIKEGLERAEKHFNRSFPFPTISFDIRGRTAGQAFYTRNHIRLNPTVFRTHENEFINRTIPHELAHLISYAVYGVSGKGHKDNWRSVCRVLGMSDVTRCHAYNVQPAWTRRPATRYAFNCDCQTHMITSVRVKKINRGVIYRCKRCRGALRPKLNTWGLASKVK